MTNRISLFFVLLLPFALSLMTAAVPARAEGYARPELLVETDWVQAHAADTNVRWWICVTKKRMQQATFPRPCAWKKDRSAIPKSGLRTCPGPKPSRP